MLFYRIASLVSLILIGGLEPGWSQDEIFKQNYTDHGDTFVIVESIFGSSARQGSLPFRITIRNNSGKDRVWTVEMREGNPGRALNTASSHPIAVENGSEVQRDITFPFAPAYLAYDYRNLNVDVRSPGLPPQNRNQGEQTNQSFPALAMSKTLAQRSLSRLDDRVEKMHSGNPVFAKSFDAAYLPTDWNGYTGLDALLIDLKSWQSLTLAQRQALIAWVRLGGRVDVYVETDLTLASLELPLKPSDATAKMVSLSLGEIRIQEWDGSELSDKIIPIYDNLPSRSKSLENQFRESWELQKILGTREFNPTFVFILLLAFAILVAPVNLFYFAKSGKRHRLFVTTPIISVATCLLVIVVILFTDGIGGKGIRTVLADLQPAKDEMRLYLSQEQISRTGVMVNTGFETGSAYDLNPVHLPSGNFNTLSNNRRKSTTYEINGNAYNGGFFPSRSDQGFTIRSAEPTRSRIELAPGGTDGTPSLTSSLPQAIIDLVYIAEDGTLWTTPPGTSVAPGQTIPLQKSDSTQWPEWIEESSQLFSLSLNQRFKSLQKDHNRFFARIAHADDLALPTHPGITWEKTALILTGTPVTRSATTPIPPDLTIPDKATHE